MNKQYIKHIDLSLIDENTGQIEGLPANPRSISADNYKKLLKSLKERPEMMNGRPVIVYPLNGRYVAIGGNMRIKAISELGWKDVPCWVLPEDTTAEKMQAYTITDNTGFGEWDWDMLANDWDDELLREWGLDVPDGLNHEDKATAALSGLEYNPIYFEPENRPTLRLRDCVNIEKYEAKMAALDEYDLTEDQKEVLRLFAYRFIRIDFEAVANYYAFNATEAEKDAIERLRLVLIDGGGKDGLQGYVQDDMIKIADLSRSAVMENAE